MKSNISNALQDFGLDNKEIRVYLAVLSNGPSTATEIAKISRVNRTTIYVVAQQLIEKGLLSEYKAKYGTHYVALNPKLLVTKADSLREKISTIMPELMALEKKELREPSVKYLKGKEGYISVLDDSLSGYSHEILYFGSADDLIAVVSQKYGEKYIEERVKRKIRFRQIVRDDKFSGTQKETDIKSLRQTKFLPKSPEIRANMLIYGDKIAFFSSDKEMSCMLLESPDIFHMERAKFDLLWERLP